MSSSIVSGNAVVFSTSTGASPVTASITWSLGAGSNRAVILAFSHEQTAANRIASSVTVGGVAFTKIINNAYGTGSSHAHAEIWACNDSSAGSIGANPTISIAWANGGTLMAQGVIVTAQDCDQTLANWTFTDTDGQLATSALTGDLTGFTAGSLVIGSYCDQTGGVSVNCAVTGGDATTEFASSDVNFNSANARAVQFYASAADTTPHFLVQRNTSSGSVYQSLVIAGVPDAVTGPVITSTSDDTPTNGATLTISGTGFEASQGAGGVTAAGTGWTETSWSATAIQATVALGNNRYNANVSLVVTNNSSQSSAGYNVQIQPESGTAYVNLSGTPASSGVRITAIPDLVGTEQLRYYGVVGGTISDVTIATNATFSYVDGVTGFYVQAHDGTSWGTAGWQDTSVATAELRGLARPLARDLVRDLSRDLSA